MCYQFPMPLDLYLTYFIACVLVAILPGPIVTLIVSNSITHGTRAGLLNVAGAQSGLAVFLLVTLAGLATLISALGTWFDWLRFLGAAYLVWLGWRLLWAPAPVLEAGAHPSRPRSGFYLQGLLVMLSNPKVLMFFGAFLPQFIDESRSYVPQVALLSVTFMVVAVIFDSFLAVAAGSARRFVTARYMHMISRISGGFLIGGGIWLALMRAK